MRKGISKIYQMRQLLEGSEPVTPRYATYRGPLIKDLARELRIIEHTERVQADLLRLGAEPNGNTIQLARPSGNAIKRRMLRAKRRKEVA